MKYYIKCNTNEESRNCQKKLFNLGYIWCSGTKKILDFSVPVLLIADEDKTITWSRNVNTTDVYSINTCPLFKMISKLELE